MKFTYFLLILLVLGNLSCTKQSQNLVNENIEDDSGSVVVVDDVEFEELTNEQETNPSKDGSAVAEKSKNQNIKVEQEELPKTFDHDVKFVCQAPFLDWNLPYQETCEEAVLVLADSYLNNLPLNKQIMDQELLKAISWQKERWGLYTDTNLDEIKQLAEEHFNLSLKIIENPTVDLIKKELVKGNLIMVPTYGRLLDNPYFTGAGPIFHMVLVRGYDRNEFITNDVGTWRGEKYKYKYDVLLDANYDLPLNEDGTVFRPFEEKIADKIKVEKMLTGPKQIAIISK